MHDRHRDIALFRYSLIREAADPALTPTERGRLVRYLAARDHLDPHGERVRVGRSTLDRWIRAWRGGGFDALVPQARSAEPKTPAALLDLAVRLKLEVPARTAAQVCRIIEADKGWAPSERTVQRHFARRGLNVRPDGQPLEVFGRFEADTTNVLWTGDALHGPVIGGRKVYLLAFIDDHSRLLVGYRWCHSEDTIRLEAALRAGLASRGIPGGIYVDNGSAFASKPLLRACASLGVRLTHSTPRRPEGRGKIERFFRTVRDQFLVEITVSGPTDLDEMNRLFSAWVEGVYHRQVHSETGEAPLDRFDTSIVRFPTAGELHEAFLWSETRVVSKVATVSLLGNHYQVDAALAGQRVELVFDPFDLTHIEVRLRDLPMGTAVPQHIGRHTHPAARPDPTQLAAPTATGIDYLRLIETERDRNLAASGGIDFHQLALPKEPIVQPRTTNKQDQP
ncbi:MAG: DDE-type integrase/transposase/recombinase [Microthrixaceae bacterium]|nr:DDE-type integrase/transposase/recombinase [Microthrixaceae bacterium]MCO5312742.1 DDE-type integrase/transposase/recombinase [Microthrixaceae bacterium]HPB45928.1 DDE-type integrase/transposase/recombinase [Microthrixaceae bacterium]